jgi:hypothetical protein
VRAGALAARGLGWSAARTRASGGLRDERWRCQHITVGCSARGITASHWTAQTWRYPVACMQWQRWKEKRSEARPDVRPGDRQWLASGPVHTLDANVSGDARSNLISSPNRGPPCTLHDSTSKTVSEMPCAPKWDAPCTRGSKHAAEAVARVAGSASRRFASLLGTDGSRFRRGSARLAAAAPSAHQGRSIARAHAATSTACHAAVLHQAVLATASAGRR